MGQMAGFSQCPLLSYYAVGVFGYVFYDIKTLFKK